MISFDLKLNTTDIYKRVPNGFFKKLCVFFFPNFFGGEKLAKNSPPKKIAA
jgi:hypothetical protein